MTLMLELSTELEQRLQQGAAKAGVPAVQYALKALEERLSRPDPKALIDLLDSWEKEDATNDPAELEVRRREWEEFKSAINESHSSNRKIFP